MKTVSISSLSALLLSVQLASAAFFPAPNVTVVPLSTDCHDWPNWQNVRGVDITGAFTFVSDQTGDEGSNALRLGTRTYKEADGSDHQFLVVDVRKSHYLTTILTSYCKDGTVYYGYLGTDPKPPLVISSSGTLKPEGTGFKLEAYAHYVGGERQPGVFLGTQNKTTWGFSYVQPADCGSRDFYDISLQGISNGASRDPMLLGFIKAEGL